MGVLAVRLSGLHGLHRELLWDGENMKFTNISPTDTIKIVTVDDLKLLMVILVLIVVLRTLMLLMLRMSGLSILIIMGLVYPVCHSENIERS